MALGLLCLGFLLMGALKIQALESVPKFTSSISSALRNFLQDPDFQYYRFQGKWYTVGWAQNTVWNEQEFRAALHSTTFKLNDDHSYNVTCDWLSDQGCDHKFSVMFPTDRPGLFTLANKTRYDGLQNSTLRVLETDYDQFAMVLFKMIIQNMVHLEHVLYGRNKELSPEVKERYRDMARSLGLSDDFINFNDPMGKCNEY